MDDDLNCPICFETPEKEIYQCVNGHTICNICSENINECPQCREPYGPKKIRNRALEQILDKQTFNCNFKDNGCLEKLNRQDITKHSETCSKANANPIYLCKILGYDACTHILDTSNRAATLKHFKDHHGAVVQGGHEAVVWNSNYQSVIETTYGSKWSLVLLEVDETWAKDSLFLVVGQVNSDSKFVSWACLQLFGVEKAIAEPLEVEFTVKDLADLDQNVSKFRCRTWTDPVISVNDEDDVKNCLDCCAINISLKFMGKWCKDNSDISITVNLKHANESSEEEDHDESVYEYGHYSETEDEYDYVGEYEENEESNHDTDNDGYFDDYTQPPGTFVDTDDDDDDDWE
ncbi:E3 ubiquitin-protein ligase Siah2 [Orchesella cincta]|uniref:E3 ubiquitin-protein ligase Siah2 n=1 Tax=Orchesella cincta TaxID=48709 RepID=A0A1D2MI34_ORCCI|nr:E3 ubiquitin-protein ligase Siah2 [Orchesella cincta]